MQKSFTENKFKEILDTLDIKKNNKILVNSNTLNLMIKYKDKNLPSKILNNLIEKISPKGTLLLPTYNWGFCRELNYDFLNTKSATGALSNLSLNNKDFVRSKNPIYSFSIYGKNKNEIAELEVKAGSAVFMINSMVHCGYPMTKKDRVKITITITITERYNPLQKIPFLKDEKAPLNIPYRADYNNILD
jgi:hypothetical protein